MELSGEGGGRRGPQGTAALAPGIYCVGQSQPHPEVALGFGFVSLSSEPLGFLLGVSREGQVPPDGPRGQPEPLHALGAGWAGANGFLPSPP